MKRYLTSLIAITMIASVAFAGNTQTRSNLITLFSDRHNEATDEEVLAAGEEVEATLREMSADMSLYTFIRIRAMGALGQFHGDDTAKHLKDAAGASEKNVAVRGAALRALARCQGDAATRFIAGYLNHKESLLNFSATKSLETIGSISAFRALGSAESKTRKAGDIKPLGD